jgi:hypothetical protein
LDCVSSAFLLVVSASAMVVFRFFFRFLSGEKCALTPRANRRFTSAKDDAGLTESFLELTRRLLASQQQASGAGYVVSPDNKFLMLLPHDLHGKYRGVSIFKDVFPS